MPIRNEENENHKAKREQYSHLFFELMGSSTKIANIPEITESLPKMFKWMIYCQDKLEFSNYCFHKTFSIFYSFLKKIKTKNQTEIDLNLILAVCLFLAYKYEDYSKPRMTVEFLEEHILLNQYSSKEILKMELCILRTFKFRMNDCELFKFDDFLLSDAKQIFSNEKMNTYIDLFNVNRKKFLYFFNYWVNLYPLDVSYLVFMVTLNQMFETQKLSEKSYNHVKGLINRKYVKYLSIYKNENIIDEFMSLINDKYFLLD